MAKWTNLKRQHEDDTWNKVDIKFYIILRINQTLLQICFIKQENIKKLRWWEYFLNVSFPCSLHHNYCVSDESILENIFMRICMYMYIFYQKFVIFLKNEITLLFFKNITSIQIKWVICSKKRDSSQFLGKRVGYITFSYSKVGIVFFHLL